MRKADVERLEEIKEEIEVLLDETRNLIRHTSEWERAKAYWFGNISAALGDNSGFIQMGYKMEDTIFALEGQVHTCVHCDEDIKIPYEEDFCSEECYSEAHNDILAGDGE